MNVFENLRYGAAYDIRDEEYRRQVHGEIDRCDHLCWKINTTDPAEKAAILELENELTAG